MTDVLLKKMQTEFSEPVSYFIVDDNNRIYVNDYLGKFLKIEFTEKYNCIKCGTKTNKIFGEGFCYKCFTTAPEADVCMVQPEKCQAHLGICRDMNYAKDNCLKPHYVYLAKTNEIKVGITRQSMIPTRWIDQGADEAIKIAKVPNRYTSGIVEIEMKKYFTDKTSWQKMLKNETCAQNLIDEKQKAISQFPDDFKKFIVNDNEIIKIFYPQIFVPQNIKSIKFGDNKVIEGVLTGIKGQYLIFDNMNVFNVRSHSGFNVKISISEPKTNEIF